MADAIESVSEASSVGFWGSVTANVDWCEANYEVTHYIAEFWNTVSNAAMFFLPLSGILYGIKDGLELRYITCFLSIMVVGTGSTLFHSTLLYECQLLDELPMLWGNCVFLYTIIETRSLPKTANIPLIVALTSYCVLVTMVYICFNIPIIFQGAYGLSVLVIIYYGQKMISYHGNTLYLFTISISLFGSGFLLWILDNLYCDTFRSVRNQLGYPLKPLFQGHAWWHVLAGLGTYTAILFSVYTRVTFLKQDPYMYTSMGLPTVIRVRTKGNI